MTLDDLKAEANVTHDADDALLARKLDAAKGFVERYIGHQLDELDPLPPEIVEATLRLAAHYYTVGDGTPAGIVERLRPFRAWSF